MRNEMAVATTNDALQRLSYYLYCIDTGCGTNFIQEEKIIDFENVQALPETLRSALIQLAHTFFNHTNVLGKIVFTDKPNLLPPETSHGFYQMKDSETGAIVDTEVLIAEYRSVVSTVLVCTKDWMIYYYQDPLNALLVSHSRPTAGLLENVLNLSKRDHCVHCKGLAGGDCACMFLVVLDTLTASAAALNTARIAKVLTTSALVRVGVLEKPAVSATSSTPTFTATNACPIPTDQSGVRDTSASTVLRRVTQILRSISVCNAITMVSTISITHSNALFERVPSRQVCGLEAR